MLPKHIMLSLLIALANPLTNFLRKHHRPTIIILRFCHLLLHLRRRSKQYHPRLYCGDLARKYRKRPQFVLVHGASHGAWCWFKLRWLLESSGQRVSAIDLAGAGIDLTDPNSIQSFDDYNRPLLALLSALPDRENVILVGHSAGGLSVVQAIHLFADKIKLAIFVAATMLPFGFRTDQDRKDGIPGYGDSFMVNHGLGVDHPPTSVVTQKEFRHKLTYKLTPGEDTTLASMLLRPAPTVLVDARFGEGEEEEERLKQVKRVFIKTMHDHILKTEQQDAMIRRWPPAEVFTVDTDHSPFFAAPNELFELIVKASLA